MTNRKTKYTKSAGGVVLNELGEVLVVSQKGVSWSLPKGHTEDVDKNMIETSKREIYEESGVKDLEFIKKLGTYKRYKMSATGGDDTSEQKEITIFLFKSKSQKLNPIDPENPEARWVKLDDVENLLTHKKDKEFFNKVKHKLNAQYNFIPRF